MIPIQHHDNIFVYKNVFELPENFQEILKRGTRDDWSVIPLHTVAEATTSNCKSELGNLSLLSSEIQDSFVDYMREHVTKIDAAGQRVWKDFFIAQDLELGTSGMFNLLWISKAKDQVRSVILGNNSLEEGLAIEICAIGNKHFDVIFPHLGVVAPMEQGDILFAPGGFPFSHLVETQDQAILLKRQRTH